jgi:hypothetical protein
MIVIFSCNLRCAYSQNRGVVQETCDVSRPGPSVQANYFMEILSLGGQELWLTSLSINLLLRGWVGQLPDSCFRKRSKYSEFKGLLRF